VSVGVANELYEVEIPGLWVLGTANNATLILLLHYHSLLVTQLLEATRGDAGLTAHSILDNLWHTATTLFHKHIARAITLRAKQM